MKRRKAKKQSKKSKHVKTKKSRKSTRRKKPAVVKQVPEPVPDPALAPFTQSAI